MKNVILSVVVVAVLIAGGLGGTLAGWSDSEISYDNRIETGSLDLKVNGQDDIPWGTGVGPVVDCSCIIPCCENCWSEVIELWNAGQCCSGDLFIHFKEFCCYDILQEHTGTVPEPELVAEGGGMVGQVEVPPWGGECDLPLHVDATIYEVDCETGAIISTLVGPVKIGELESKQIYVTTLEPCEPVCLLILFHLQQIEDPDWEERGLLEKFKDWPTNALMKDGMMFDIEFDLLQVPKAE